MPHPAPPPPIPTAPSAEDVALHDEAMTVLNRALMSLAERQRKVIALRFGLLGKPLSQTAVAEVLGVSQKTVCNIERVALERLKGELWDYCGEDGLAAFLVAA